MTFVIERGGTLNKWVARKVLADTPMMVQLLLRHGCSKCGETVSHRREEIEVNTPVVIECECGRRWRVECLDSAAIPTGGYGLMPESELVAELLDA